VQNAVITVRQPTWLAQWLAVRTVPTCDAARLEEVLALTSEAVTRASGGPFAAIVYDQRSGERLAAAVNTVLPNCTALAHAETSALALAQQSLGQYSLAYPGGPEALLVTSSAPCTMCLGAIAWSGVQRLLFSTTRNDVEEIGFDEGPATPRWRQELIKRGITVQGPRLRARGQRLLQAYALGQGRIYNA